MRDALGLLRRTALAHASVPLALGLLVVLVSLAGTATPRMLADVADRQVTHELDRAGALGRDLVGVLPGRWPQLPPPATPAGVAADLPPAAAEVHAGNLAFLEQVRADQPEPLRSLLGDPHLTVETGAAAIAPVPGGAIGRPAVTFKSDPLLAGHVELTEGRWPEAPAVVNPFDGMTEDEYRALTLDELEAERRRADEATGVIEVVLGEDAAATLEWPVGAERAVPGSGVPLLLVGTFRPLDPDGPFWVHNPHSVDAHVVDDLNLGTSAEASAYLAPDWAGTLPVGYPTAGVTTRAWFPVDPDALRGDQVAEVLAQVRGLAATDLPWGDAPGAALDLSAGLVDVLEQVQEQQRTTSTVLAIVAAGPIGVTLAVLWLGARLVTTRRAAALGILSARGGSAVQLRAALALEGLVVGLPAAAVGAVLGTLLVPGRLDAGSLLLPALAGVAPAAVLAAAPMPRGLHTPRADLGRARGRLRVAGEVAVLALAALGVLALRRPGVDGAAADAVTADGGVDLLVAAVPLLLALAASVLVLRLYPWPVRAVEKVLRRRRDLPAFLGAARAVREPAGGLVPAVALVVGVGVAVFSAVLTTTLGQGVEGTAWRALGADVRVSGPIVHAEDAERVAAVDGVAGVARVTDAGRFHLSGADGRVALVTLDAAAAREAQRDAVGTTALPDELTQPDGGALPVLATSAVGVAPGADGLRLAVGSGGVPVDVVAVGDQIGGVRTDVATLVADHAVVEELVGADLHPRVLLVDVADGADPEAVVAGVREVLPTGRVESLAAATSTYLEAPVTAGTAAALRVAVGLSAVLVVAALVLTQMLGAPRRAGVLTVLRALGMASPGARHVVAWELVPISLAALAGGAILGVVVPAVVLGALDVAVLTGGPSSAGPVLDPLVLGGVVAGLLVVTAAAVTVATSIGGRVDLAARLRLGEET